MRALLERSRPARAAVVLLALGAVLGLARAAEAGGDIGLRRGTLWPDLPVALGLVETPAATPPAVAPLTVHRHRRARRIWAASRSRPLRSRSAMAQPRAHRPDHGRATNRVAGRAAAHPPRPRVAAARPPAEPQVVFPPAIVLPRPPRPALVTIYQDHTLRDGDAVMMADGIHVFHGFGEWPHLPRDFVRLTFAAALDWHLRASLDALDRNPPTRWSSAELAAG